MIASNVLMWITFTQALSKSQSSITVQVLNASANTITTGLSGLLDSRRAGSARNGGSELLFMLIGTLLLSRRERACE